MTTTIIAIVVVLLLLAALRLWLTANRLDRLHVRTEAAWAALEGALSRRVVAARAVAAAGGLEPERAAMLRGLARQADSATRAHRADAENDLSRALAALPGCVPSELSGELADAQERLTLARRFYNDAVRDTRALRAARFTRFFRLAGSAALPEYFEIAELHPQTVDRSANTTEIRTIRRSGRVVLLDDRQRVLLFHGIDPAVTGDDGFWFTPGGGAEQDESEAVCAVRELREETGLIAEPAELVGPVWVRKAEFEFMGQPFLSVESFFALQIHAESGAGSDVTVDVSGFTELERSTIDRHRWWSAAELVATADRVYPVELPARLGEVVDALEKLATHHSPQPVPID